MIITRNTGFLMPAVLRVSFPPRGLRLKVRVDQPSIPTVNDSQEKYSWEACRPISMRMKSLPVSEDLGLSLSIGHIKPNPNPTFHPKDMPFYYFRYILTYTHGSMDQFNVYKFNYFENCQNCEFEIFALKIGVDFSLKMSDVFGIFEFSDLKIVFPTAK